ncbi:hypothetical protein F3Y22_tig00110931pilonHSYRG00272 [Hibiscus syriacus]|uniref:Uncharacterized protein n=1 Tax=Hibiscus syriacus TaxID=106335 RepID=A0A6A2ZG31_HIBSY|nr:hypothetical protein F3Y22_tig00110931pilonHSYRG00272 [Hibiscus syriacus]
MEEGDFFVGGYYGGASAGDFSPDIWVSVEQKLGENFIVEDLLDFSNEESVIGDGFFDNVAGNSADSSTVTCNSSVFGGENHFSEANFTHSSQFSGELCVPYDDLAELEWLSNFVDDSFSTDPIFAKLPTPESSSSSTRSDSLSRSSIDPIFQHGDPLPGKRRGRVQNLVRSHHGVGNVYIVLRIRPHNGGLGRWVQKRYVTRVG